MVEMSTTFDQVNILLICCLLISISDEVSMICSVACKAAILIGSLILGRYAWCFVLTILNLGTVIFSSFYSEQKRTGKATQVSDWNFLCQSFSNGCFPFGVKMGLQLCAGFIYCNRKTSMTGLTFDIIRIYRR